VENPDAGADGQDPWRVLGRAGSTSRSSARVVQLPSMRARKADRARAQRRPAGHPASQRVVQRAVISAVVGGLRRGQGATSWARCSPSGTPCAVSSCKARTCSDSTERNTADWIAPTCTVVRKPARSAAPTRKRTERSGDMVKREPWRPVGAYCINLNKKRQRTHLSLIGARTRDERTIQDPLPAHKNNPLRRRTGGSERPRFAEGLARRIVHGEG